MKNNFRLGVFVALGLIGIMVSILALGNIAVGKTYTVYVSFPNASGLMKKAKVKIAGVDVGILKEFALKNSQAYLTLAINENIVLYENASARIVSMGIIGTKYISIDPGDSSYPVLQHGGIIRGNSGGSIDDLINGGSAGDMLGNLSSTIRDLKTIVSAIAAQNEQITSAIHNLSEFSYNVAQITSQNKDDIRASMEAMREITAKLDVIVTNLTNGQGTAGALLTDEQMKENLKETIASARDAVNGLKTALVSAGTLQFEWNYTGRYNTRDSAFRSDGGMTIMPNNNKFYYIGISNIGDRNASNNKDSRDSINTLDALLGFRFNKAEVYGGAMRSKAGVGAGVSLFQPVYAPYRSVYLFANAYDFGRPKTNNNSANIPRIDAGVKFGITKWLYAGAMVEDAADKKPSFTPFIRLEIKDKDISNLFGIIGIAAMAGAGK